MAGWKTRFWQPYVPVAARRRLAERHAASLAKKGRTLEPVRVLGRDITHTFWGKSWCENLERYSDFANRLPRGRTYIRNGSVIDLQVRSGRVEALVSGSSIYTTSIGFATLSPSRWKAIKSACAGRIDSVVELLRGTFSDGVMEVLTAPTTGLFPAPKEISMSCSCPDSAHMCKHVAAVLYGVGALLDTRPELFFQVRGVDHSELISEAAGSAVLAGAGADGSTEMSGDEVERVFGIELAPRDESKPRPPRRVRRLPAPRATKPVLPAAAARGRSASANGGRPKKADARKVASSEGEPSAIGARTALLQDHFREHHAVTNAQYRALFGIKSAEATRELTILAGEKVLARCGKKRGTYYVPGMQWS